RGRLGGRRISDLGVGASVVRREERADNELAGRNGRDRTTDLRNDAAVLVPQRSRLGNRGDAAVWPQVRPAHARCRHPDMASVGLMIFGTSRSSKRMSRGPYRTAPRMFISKAGS